jgi:transcriptional regulator with XRE-family HTH domain
MSNSTLPGTDPTALTTVGDRLRYHRIRNGFPAEKVALETDRSAATIRRWETGQITPPPVKIGQLARLYGCSFEEITSPGGTPQ